MDCSRSSRSRVRNANRCSHSLYSSSAIIFTGPIASIRAFISRKFVSAAASSSPPRRDRKSTRLNSSHGYISYAVFCLKKKKVDLVHQQTQNQRYGSSHIGATAKDISHVVTDPASRVVDIFHGIDKAVADTWNNFWRVGIADCVGSVLSLK